MTTPVRNDEQSRVPIDGRRTFVPVLLRLACGSNTGIRVYVVSPGPIYTAGLVELAGDGKAQI